MPFQPSENLPDFDKLKSIFLNAKLQSTNFPLFQTINNFLDSTSKSQRILNQKIEELESLVGGLSAGGDVELTNFIPPPEGEDIVESFIPSPQILTKTILRIEQGISIGLDVEEDSSSEFFLLGTPVGIGDYLRKDGSVALTANWDAGPFDIRAATLTPDGITLGSIMFAGANGVISQDNSNLFWDDTNNYFGIGINPPDAALNIERTYTDLSGSESLIDATILINPASASTWAGIGINMTVAKIGSQDSTASHSAFQAIIAHSGTGTIQEFKGVALQCFNVLGGTLDFGIGGAFTIANLGVGTIGDAVAQQNLIQNSNASGTMGEGVGFRLLDLINAGTITSTFGIQIKSLTAGTQTNTPFAIHSLDAGAQIFFAGLTALAPTEPTYPSGTAGLIIGLGTALSSMGANTAGIYPTDVGSSNACMVAIAEDDRLTRLNGPFAPLGVNLEESQIEFASTELTALSGGTATATNLIPAGSFLIGVTIRVTTTITGATTFDIGDGTDVDRWGAAILLPAGTTTSITDFTEIAPIQPQLFPTANNVVLTKNGADFSAGAVRITVHYFNLVAATS